MLPPSQRWWDPEDDLVDCQEVIQVQGRVGMTPRARLQWALDFARRDLATLTTFDWENLRREIMAFDIFLIPYDQAATARPAQRLEESVRVPATFPLQPVPLPNREKLQRSHDDFQQYISPLIQKKEVKIPLGGSTVYVLPTPVHGRTFFHVQNRGPLGLTTLAHLLGAFAPLVRACAEQQCGRWFVAGRLNQHYCSPRCQSRATSRVHRQRERKNQIRGRRKT